MGPTWRLKAGEASERSDVWAAGKLYAGSIEGRVRVQRRKSFLHALLRRYGEEEEAQK